MNNKTHTKIFKVNYQGKQFELSARHKETGGELILFLHGLGCTKESFDDAFDFPQFADYQLLAIDLVGYGGSSKPQDFSYSMEDQAEIAGLILDEIEIQRIHVVAHSMGGAIGLLLVENISDRLASFINIEGNLIAEDCGLVSRNTAGIPFEEFRDTVFDKLRSKGPKPWRELSVKSDPLGFHRSSISLVEWSDCEKLLEVFRRLDVTRAYVYGDQNADMDIIPRLEGIRKIAVSNSGHFVMNDNPAEFYALVYAIASGRP
jgi:pimeloyl-ACP methyl ester carboxylesterase